MQFDRVRKVGSAEARENQADIAEKQQGASSAESARAALATNTVSVDRGDVATLPIRIAGETDSATLTIESGASDYQADTAVTDGDGDGVVIVEFDTRAAGATDSVSPVVWTADADDAATLRNQVTSDAALPPGGYRIRVAAQTDGTTESTPTDAGILSIGTRSTDKIQVLTAPGSVDPDVDGDGTVEMVDLVALDRSGRLSADQTIATTDWVVLQVKASGLEGLVRNRSTFDAAIGDELALVITRVNEESTETNSSAVRLETDNLTANDAVTLVPAPGRDNYFVVINASRATVTDGSTTTGVAVPDAVYRATFAVTDERLRPADGDEPNVIQTAFKTVEPSATFGRDTVTVTPSANQTIVGATSMAPGTEVTVSVASANETEDKFVRKKTATVEKNGRFSASFDFAGQPTGSTLELAASAATSRGATLLKSTTVRVVSEGQAGEPTTKPEKTGTVASSVPPELSPPLRDRETGSDAEGTVDRVVLPEDTARSIGGTGPVGTVFIPVLVGTLVVTFVFVRNRKK
ncbi:hypothetical protein BM92_15805 (plasmid) [Haloferax mediterranei ATCC 33500]|nr:BGTF surface domain-containing protein [Haloferax mediterranei]AHZ24383.1 hypothetical protein BM92_15805 [Haloferax mediterranei ATCC 33500]